MIDPTSAWLNALSFLVGYSAAELQHRIRKHLRSMGPPCGSYGLPPELDRRFGVPFDEGRVQRGNGSGGPTTPKPDIIPKPQLPHGRVVDVYGCTVGYIPLRQGGTPNPPPDVP